MEHVLQEIQGKSEGTCKYGTASYSQQLAILVHPEFNSTCTGLATFQDIQGQNILMPYSATSMYVRNKDINHVVNKHRY